MTRDEFYEEVIPVLSRRKSADWYIELTEQLIRDEMLREELPIFDLDSLDGIMDAVCYYFNFSRDAVMGKSRRAWLVQSRFLFYRLARHCGYEPPEIAEFMDVCRSSVIHGIYTAREDAAMDKKYSELFDYLKTNI
jgi:chromosomal replication initiation ATPase DnaA